LWYLSFCFTGRLKSSSVPHTGHITHNSTPDQRPVNQRVKYHRQQPSL